MMDDLDSLSLDNEQKLKIGIELLRQIVKVDDIALSKFANREHELLLFYMINYLERFIHSIDSIRILLGEFKPPFSVEPSIGLIIRPCLLDFMTLLYLGTYEGDINDKPNQQFDDQLNAMLTDQIRNTLRYLKLVKDRRSISKSNYDIAITNIRLRYSYLFNRGEVDVENPERNLITNDFVSPLRIFNRIHQHKATKEISGGMYDYYQLYSKYEHFGMMNYYLQRRPINDAFADIMSSIRYIMRGISTILSSIDPDRKMITGEIEEHTKLYTQFRALGEETSNG